MGYRIHSDGHLCCGAHHTPRLAHTALPTTQRRWDYRRVLVGAPSHQVTSGIYRRWGCTNSANRGWRELRAGNRGEHTTLSCPQILYSCLVGHLLTLVDIYGWRNLSRKCTNYQKMKETRLCIPLYVQFLNNSAKIWVSISHLKGVYDDLDAPVLLQSMLLFLFVFFNVIVLIKLLKISNGLSGPKGSLWTNIRQLVVFPSLILCIESMFKLQVNVAQIQFHKRQWKRI